MKNRKKGTGGGRRREEKEEGEEETRSLSAAAVRVAAWAMHHPKACQPYLHTYLCSRYLFDSASCAVQTAWLFLLSHSVKAGDGGVGLRARGAQHRLRRVML